MVMNHAGQEYDLSETGQLLPLSSESLLTSGTRYDDGATIDWLREETAERDRVRALRSQRGVRGVLGPAIDSSKLWLVLVLTGIGIGIVGAWLDILVKWYEGTQVRDLDLLSLIRAYVGWVT